MSSDTIPSSSQSSPPSSLSSSFGTIHCDPSGAEQQHRANAMITATGAHPRPLPTLSVQPPDAHLSTAIAHYEAVITPNGDEGTTPIPSTPGSPPAVLSTATTPVVPLSAANPQRNPFPGSPSVGSTAGSKRTASGTVKPISTDPSSPATPATPATPGHFARSQSSHDTSPRNVSRLKTRLTYALLKVQNNWTSESLDQIEARVSQGQHPTSPRIRIKRESSIGDEAGFDHILRHHRTNSEPSSAHPLSQNHPAGSSGRTYESFWREHEHNPITKTILQAKAASHALGSTTSKHVSSTSLSRSGLQPPAQIIPDRDRRSYYNPARQPPGLHPSLSNQSNASTVSMVPNTPPLVSTPDTQRTMEQDAVESLMFLSSPGHTQRRLSQSQSQSQPRALANMIVEEEPPVSQPERYNYSRNATTWPRSRRAFKQARTSLGSLRMMDSGVGFDDELTDEDVSEEYQRVPEKGKGKEDELGARVIPSGNRQPDGDVGVAAAAS
ncbi:hypothetical protein K440DRAFT_640691 [Wilcoxina mikolae CBS 423.85]|nr:hypothetical protein K440DRAFT_640691 [Wilcoxina mikolae CBS 423.85]